MDEDIKKETTTVKPKAKPKSKIIKAEDTALRAVITIDNLPKEVVSLDREGYLLSFDDEPGKFLYLEDEILDELSKNNYTSYMISEGFHARRRKEKEHPEDFSTAGIKMEGRFSTATARLKVEGQDPGMHPCWKRPDELQQAAYEGYRIAKGESLRTFMGEGNMVHKVGALGKDELILTEIPNKLYKERQRMVEEKSKSRIAMVEKNAIEDMRRAGGKAYVPNEDDSVWSESRR